MNQLGIVIIGRNEGERLRRCLESVVGQGAPVVYVDSQSTDGSAELARGLGPEVVVLDNSQPICVPRARNEGFARLCRIAPDVRFVQFVDGDCEVVAGWLDQGRSILEQRPDVALVTGRRRERFPERSIYNRLADLEWDMPVGEIKGSHGDVMVRTDAFHQVGGFDATVFVGEDYDLCIRLRNNGWVLLRIDAEMTLHDMAMTRFGQWWRRSVRSGYGFAEGARLHGKLPDRHFVRDRRSILFWGIVLPIVILVLAIPTRGASLILALAYPLQAFRVARRSQTAGLPRRLAWLYSGACVLGRFPNAIGAIRYWYTRLLGRRRPLIEYKNKPQTGPQVS
jgi:GT2 family glycosyltransferase